MPLTTLNIIKHSPLNYHHSSTQHLQDVEALFASPEDFLFYIRCSSSSFIRKAILSLNTTKWRPKVRTKWVIKRMVGGFLFDPAVAFRLEHIQKLIRVCFTISSSD